MTLSNLNKNRGYLQIITADESQDQVGALLHHRFFAREDAAQIKEGT